MHKTHIGCRSVQGELALQMTLPTFHFWGIDDDKIPPKKSQWLAALYKRPVIFMRR